MNKLTLPPEAKLIAIGGGGMKSNRPLFEDGIEMTGAEKPKALLIPTAKYTREKHDKSVEISRRLFEEALGVDFDVLHGFAHDGEELNPAELEEKMAESDIFYIAGGNTRAAMDIWQRSHIDTLIARALKEGKVFTGISAGALAWFRGAHSDSESYEVEEGEDWDYIYTNGLGYIDAIACPHYDSEKDGEVRADNFKNMMLSRRDQEGVVEVGLGLENNAGLMVVEGLFAVVNSVETARGHIVRVDDNGEITDDEIDPNDLRPLNELNQILS